MVIKAIIDKIRRDLKSENPEFTSEEIEFVAMQVYKEYQRILLTGSGNPNSFSGVYYLPKKEVK